MPDHDAIALEVQGILGGAAAGKPRPLTPSSPVSGIPAPTPVAQTPVLLWVGIVAAVVAIAASVVIRSHYQVRPVALDVAGAVIAGEAFLRQDDEASLDKAEASFAKAESLEPKNPDHHAQRAFVMLLKGASLRAESDDLLNELTRSSPAAEVLAAMPDAERIRLQQHANSVRQQLPSLTRRSDELITKGLWLARSAERQNDSPSPAVRRTTWLANAYDHHIDRLTKQPHDGKVGTEGGQETLSWWRFARGIGRELSDAAAPGIGTAEAELMEAVNANPSNLRAKWELARLYLARTPPDSRASRLLEQILSANPQHEGALRGAALLRSQAQLPRLDPN
jgi:hypothetical protein